MAALAGIKSNILLSAGHVRQVAVGCRYFNMAKWLVHRKSGRPKQVAVHPRDRRWQVLLYDAVPIADSEREPQELLNTIVESSRQKD